MTIDNLGIELSLIPLFLLYRASMMPISAGTATLQLKSHGVERTVSAVSQILRRLAVKGYIAEVAEKNGDQLAKAYRATRRGRAEVNKCRAYIRLLGRTPQSHFRHQKR